MDLRTNLGQEQMPGQAAHPVDSLLHTACVPVGFGCICSVEQTSPAERELNERAQNENENKNDSTNEREREREAQNENESGQNES